MICITEPSAIITLNQLLLPYANANIARDCRLRFLITQTSKALELLAAPCTLLPGTGRASRGTDAGRG